MQRIFLYRIAGTVLFLFAAFIPYVHTEHANGNCAYYCEARKHYDYITGHGVSHGEILKTDLYYDYGRL